MAAARYYQFHGFRVDTLQRQLYGPDGRVVELPSRAFDTLVYLLEHHGEDVRKDELLRAVWPDTVVEENSLNQCISALRRAFGERRSSPRFLLTVPGRGYRFIAELTAAAADDEPASSAQPRAKGPPRKALAGLVLVLCVVALTFAVWSIGRQPAATKPPLATIAVLPFTSLTVDPESAALELGMAETLIGHVSALPGVVVRPIGVVRRYAGPEQDPMQAGRELEADVVFAASIQTDANRIRVAARLLQVADGRSIWNRRFDAELRTIFDVQDAIAAMVMETLAAELGTQAPKELPVRATKDVEAYRSYLSGVYSRQRHDLRGAAESFRTAVQQDPQYALAWSALSATLSALGTFHWEPPAAVFAEARSAALRAIELAPDLAEAQAALGHVLMQEGRYAEAEARYGRARELDPNGALIRLWTSLNYLNLGRHDDALEQARLAQALEPGTLPFGLNVGLVLYYTARYEEAVFELRRVLALEPAFDHAHSLLGRALLELDNADAALEHSHARRQPSPGSRADFGRAYAKMSLPAEARAEIERLRELEPQGFDVAYDIAAIHALLGDTGQACATLASAPRVRSITGGLLRLDPAFAGMRGERCFTTAADQARPVEMP